MADALRLQWDTGLMASNLLDVSEPDVVRSTPLSLQTGDLPGTHSECRGPSAPGAPRSHPDGSHGIVAATNWFGLSRADHSVFFG